MILQDNPIQKQSQDELGRISMVELIANSIIEFSKKYLSGYTEPMYCKDLYDQPCSKLFSHQREPR